MAPEQKIILIDDDSEDIEFMLEAFAELETENEIKVFKDGADFLHYIQESEDKFLFILCDINMGKINGLDLKKRVMADDRLRRKCVPFLFFSTARSSAAVEEAYSYNVQGYFVKPSKLADFTSLFRTLIDYWNVSEKPNSPSIIG